MSAIPATATVVQPAVTVVQPAVVLVKPEEVAAQPVTKKEVIDGNVNKLTSVITDTIDKDQLALGAIAMAKAYKTFAPLSDADKCARVCEIAALIIGNCDLTTREQIQKIVNERLLKQEKVEEPKQPVLPKLELVTAKQSPVISKAPKAAQRGLLARIFYCGRRAQKVEA